jgi:hypothetical protein
LAGISVFAPAGTSSERSRTVLRRADELLAFVEEDGSAERVDDEQRLDGALIADLGDGQPAGDRLVEADVVECRLALA